MSMSIKLHVNDIRFLLESVLTILKRLIDLMSTSLLAKKTPRVFGVHPDYSKETYMPKVFLAT